jgi:hypothetical protein
MTTPDTRLATPMQAWQQAMGAGLATVSRVGAAAVTATSDTTVSATPRRSWWSRGLRVLRDVALGLSLVAAIPLATIHYLGAPEWSANSISDRMAEVARIRPLAATVDPRITPRDAGMALLRLVPAKGSKDIPVREVASDNLPWRGATLPAALFADARSTWWPGPQSIKVIEGAARGYSAAEMAWLKDIADAPLWRDADLVARAAQVDIYGARLAGPIQNVSPEAQIPTVSMRSLREIAEAGVARAAYYVAIKDLAKADDALRTVVSLGLVLMDDGVTFLDGLTGRVIVDIGRGGMRQLAAIDGRADVYAVAAPFAPRRGASMRLSFAEREERALRDLSDPSLPRAFRFEQLGLLSYASCTSVRKVLVGNSAAEEAAIVDARATLPRFASEREVMEHMQRRVDALNRPATSSDGIGRLIQGAAEVTSALTGNERIASCTRLVVRQLDPR